MEQIDVASWEGYALVSTGNGKRYERWGQHTVERPDSQVLWPVTPPWPQADWTYDGQSHKGVWQVREQAEKSWIIPWQDLKFQVSPSPFGHMEVFPEQAANWELLRRWIAGFGRPVSVLNLFAYTGAASIVAAKAGAKVCHVDASKNGLQKGRANAELNGIPEDRIRWLLDDCLAFARREVRRGNKYDIVIMDPPIFGRGNKGQIWRLHTGLPHLMEAVGALRKDGDSKLLVNFYATATYPGSIQRVVEESWGTPLRSGIISLQELESKKSLPTGFFLASA